MEKPSFLGGLFGVANAFTGKDENTFIGFSNVFYKTPGLTAKCWETVGKPLKSTSFSFPEQITSGLL